MHFNNVKNVVDWRLCVGCGVCAYICPDKKIILKNFTKQGIRPVILSDHCDSCTACIDVCPGHKLMHYSRTNTQDYISDLIQSWGPISEVWEGYPCDSEIRFLGSSAGIATTLALYCLESEKMGGVLHIGSDPEKPWLNETYLSKSRNDLLSRTGSRYSPASPCNSLNHIEFAQNPCVFIGKACDIEGLRKAQAIRPELDKKVGLAIGIFCAGTPSTQAILDLLALKSIDPEQVAEIRYRGKGWPGMFAVRLKGEQSFSTTISYQESWGFLQTYRPFRCYLCPDTTAEFADISCGDPWYREIGDNNPGFSMIIVRTDRGRQILHDAMKAGYINLIKTEPNILERSQKNQLLKRQAIWGRLLSMKLFGIPIPHFHGFYLFHNWLKLDFRNKLKSILGTIKRILKRKYTKPLSLD